MHISSRVEWGIKDWTETILDKTAKRRMARHLLFLFGNLSLFKFFCSLAIGLYNFIQKSPSGYAGNSGLEQLKTD